MLAPEMKYTPSSNWKVKLAYYNPYGESIVEVQAA
jgi:hypothetical protein